MIRFLLLASTALLTSFFTARLVPAQEAAPLPLAERQAAIERLAVLLEGEWSGDSWIQQGPGNKRTLRQTERVQRKLGGSVLLIEGTGRALSEDGTVGAVEFNALGVIAFEAPGTYKMRSYLLDGNTGSFELTVQQNGFQWSIALPRGEVRYTMQLTPEGEWLEKGAFSPDGTQWFPTMEMRLRRIVPERQ